MSMNKNCMIFIFTINNLCTPIKLQCYRILSFAFKGFSWTKLMANVVSEYDPNYKGLKDKCSTR